MINKKKRSFFRLSFLTAVVFIFSPINFLLNLTNKKIKLKKNKNLIWYLDSNDL